VPVDFFYIYFMVESPVQIYYSVAITAAAAAAALFLLACLICAAILSRSRRPWEETFLPPLASFSTSFNCSKACSPLRAILPEPRRQWLGQLPLLRRTRMKSFKLFFHELNTIQSFLLQKQLKCMWGEITDITSNIKSDWNPQGMF
jgi:hypothetical protein